MTPRRAALVASAVVLPLILVLALLFTSGKADQGEARNDPSAAVTVAAPSPSGDTALAACNALLGALPASMNGLDPRIVDSTSPYALAWGSPAVTLRCGVPRPAELVESTAAFVVASTGGVNWLPRTESSVTVFTAIDRAVYVELTEPKSQTGVALSTVSQAVAKAMPNPVCYTQPSRGPSVPDAQLCSHRP